MTTMMSSSSLRIMARAAAVRSTRSQANQQNNNVMLISRALSKSTRTSSTSTIAQEKANQKEVRRQRYQAKQERVAKLATRREGRARDVKKQQFTEWYNKRRTYHEIMNRKARQAGMDWKIQVAVIVERLPVVTPDVEEWEQQYLDLRAYLDQFTWEYPEELGMNEKEEEDDDEEDKEPPPPRETEADASGDYQTLERRLKTRIFYAQKESNDALWGFPTTLLQDDETLLEAAERLTSTTFDSSTQLMSLSNCPSAVDLEVNNQDGYYGTKTFFMRLQYLDGPATLASTADEMVDHGWLERSELAERAHAGEGPNAAKFFRYML